MVPIALTLKFSCYDPACCRLNAAGMASVVSVCSIGLKISPEDSAVGSCSSADDAHDELLDSTVTPWFLNLMTTVLILFI